MSQEGDQCCPLPCIRRAWWDWLPELFSSVKEESRSSPASALLRGLIKAVGFTKPSAQRLAHSEDSADGGCPSPESPGHGITASQGARDSRSKNPPSFLWPTHPWGALLGSAQLSSIPSDDKTLPLRSGQLRLSVGSSSFLL